MDELKTALHCMKVLAEMEVCEECSEYENCTDHTRKDVARTCVSALEKQIPKKPEFLHMLGTWTYKAKCPVCGAAFTAYIKDGENPKYCSNCGQAFDWKEESEESE